MASESDKDSRKLPRARKKGRVIEDERGHQVWQGTIETIKLSLIKTGVFIRSEAQRRLKELRRADTNVAGDDVDESLYLVEEDWGCDPYDSAKSK